MGDFPADRGQVVEGPGDPRQGGLGANGRRDKRQAGGAGEKMAAVERHDVLPVQHKLDAHSVKSMPNAPAKATCRAACHRTHVPFRRTRGKIVQSFAKKIWPPLQPIMVNSGRKTLVFQGILGAKFGHTLVKTRSYRSCEDNAQRLSCPISEYMKPRMERHYFHEVYQD